MLETFCYTHPSVDGLIWLLKFYNTFVFLLFPQWYNIFNRLRSQNNLGWIKLPKFLEKEPSRLLQVLSEYKSSHCLLVIIISFTTFTQEPTLLNFFPPAHPSSVLEWKSKQGQKEDRAWALLGHRDRKLLYVVTFFFFFECHVPIVARKQQLPFSYVFIET